MAASELLGGLLLTNAGWSKETEVSDIADPGALKVALAVGLLKSMAAVTGVPAVATGAHILILRKRKFEAIKDVAVVVVATTPTIPARLVTERSGDPAPVVMYLSFILRTDCRDTVGG